MAKIDPQRAKKLGKLLQDARGHAGISIENCAQVLNVSPETYQQAEAGTYHVSLPQLEVMAILLKVPMGYFWGSEPLPQEPEVDYEDLLMLRNRVIGVLLNQLRLRAHRSLKDVAAFLEVDESVIEAYERGETPVPYLHLEQIVRFLEGTLNLFMDDIHGPLARHETRYRLLKQFDQMSPEMRAFLTNPVNVNYLETARRISEMDVSKLRQIAEDLLEITY